MKLLSYESFVPDGFRPRGGFCPWRCCPRCVMLDLHLRVPSKGVLSKQGERKNGACLLHQD